MLIPGSVKAGDQIIHEWCGEREIVKVQRITTENEVTTNGIPGSTSYRAGIIITEKGDHFKPDGTSIGMGACHEELHPLPSELEQS